MDGFSDNSGVMVIAATNREDVLDPALLRAGRFDRQITVNLPDRLGRAAIFRVHARNKKIDPSIDFDQLARRTVGFSGADIENILNEAAILAVRGNREEVIIEDIDEAIDRRIAGPAKSSRALNEHERRAIAYHEAGHAIIGLNLKHSDKVQKITIVPRGRTGGHVLMTPDEDRFLITKKELQARIIGYLGGRSSEEIFFSDISTGAQNDIEVATRIARLMVTEYGMSSLGPIQYESDSSSVFLGRDYTSTQKNFSTQIAFEIDTEVRKIIDEAHQEAHRVLNEHKEDVILLAETLLEKETISAEEIAYLLEHRKLPNGKNGKKPNGTPEANSEEGKA
jgi:cell division protease FtsH